MRSLIPKHLQDLFKKERNPRDEESTRNFSLKLGQDVELESTRKAAAPADGERENLEHWQSLSPREQEVVALVCMGQRNYQIAETLGIAHSTVKSHLEKIFHKFNVRDRHEIRLALHHWDFRTWWKERHLLPTPLPTPGIYR